MNSVTPAYSHNTILILLTLLMSHAGWNLDQMLELMGI